MLNAVLNNLINIGWAMLLSLIHISLTLDHIPVLGTIEPGTIVING